MPSDMMSYAEYAKACKGEKSYEGYKQFAKGEGRGFLDAAGYQKAEDGGDDDDTDEVEINVNKSDTIDADSLMKSIEDYDNLSKALTESGGSRESFLQDKMMDGTITKSEQAELGRIWSGADEADQPLLRKSLTDRIEDDDPDAAALIDASDFLKSMVDQTNEALGSVQDSVERDGMVTRNLLGAQGNLIKSVARTLSQASNVIKGQQAVIDEMGRRLGVLEHEPVVRKSQGTPDPRDVRRRVPGAPPRRGGDGGNFDQLSKAQVNQGMRSLMIKAEAAGDDKAIDRLAHEAAYFESTGTVKPHIAQAIQMELGVNQ